MKPRIGLVGTGYWAGTVHAHSLAASTDVELAGVWGRNGHERDRIASEHGVVSFSNFEQLLAAVDIVDFAVPPGVQSQLAARAAAAGKDLLLEKPMGLDVGEARDLWDAINGAGVRAVVFVTRLFDPVRSAWLAASAARSWTSGHAEWSSGALVPGGRYDDSRWRQEGGALWDLGPHVLSQFVPVLGPVVSVAVPSHTPSGTTEVRFLHVNGAESTARMTLHGDPANYIEWIEFATADSSTRSPGRPLDYPLSHSRAVARLIGLRAGSVASDDRDGSSVDAGLRAVQVLGTAQELIDRRIFSPDYTLVGEPA
jgi:predicted dehydrogenase